MAKAGCDRYEEGALPAPSLAEVPVTDLFAGRTVADLAHAQGMVMSRLAHAPEPGRLAFETHFVDADSGSAVTLSELIRERPAVLIYGSASCSALNLYHQQIDEMATRFSDSVGFYFVYIREAHPAGGFSPNLFDRFAEVEIPEVAEAASLEERREAALEFAERSGFGFPVLVDTLDDAAAVRWSAWPLRIFVVGVDGTVIHAGDQGPWYFNPVNSYRHVPPAAELEREFRKRRFNRSSLEAFLESRYGADRHGD